MTTATPDEQGAQAPVEQRLVDLVGKGEAAARVESLSMSPDPDTSDLFALRATLRFDLSSLAEVRELNRAIPVCEALYLRGQNTASNEKFTATRDADDQLVVELYGVEASVELVKALFRTSKVETVLTCKIKGGGLTLEQVTALHKAHREGGLAPFAWQHNQGDLFASAPRRFVAADDLPPEA